MVLQVFYFAQLQYAMNRPTYIIANKQQKQLFTHQDTTSAAKKITEDILHNIYAETGTITGI